MKYEWKQPYSRFWVLLDDNEMPMGCIIRTDDDEYMATSFVNKQISSQGFELPVAVTVCTAFRAVCFVEAFLKLDLEERNIPGAPE